MPGDLPFHHGPLCLSGMESVPPVPRSMHDGWLASGEAKPHTRTSCGVGVQLCRISKHTRPTHKVSHIKGFVLKVHWQQFRARRTAAAALT